MKKIISFILAVLMLVSVFLMSTSAAVDAKIFGPLALTSGIDFSTAGIDYILAEEKDGSYVSGKVAPGLYTNNKLAVVFAPQDVDLTEYHFVKVCYRTDSPSRKLDVSARSSIGESWMNNHPVCENDGQWHEVVIDTHEIVGGKGALPSETAIQFTLKPFDSVTVTLTKEHFFDLKYIACFKDMAEANAYKFKASDDKEAANIDLINIFWEEATDEIINEYMDTMDKMIEAIENSPTTVEVTGTKYYVAASGNDDNDGLTPATAWKSVDKVNSIKFEAGDGVFFNRGDEWRILNPLSAKPGVTYSAYGTGAKPKLIASADGSGESRWVPTGKENVYAFVESIPDTRDVGTIVFDGGRAWGIQIQQTTQGNRLAIGRVFNGINWFDSDTNAFSGFNDLKNDLEFYHNWDNDTLYLYSAEGNPGARFGSIEIVDKGHGIGLANDGETGYAHDIVIDNIAIFGAGSHGIGGGKVKNVTVQYCTLKWIGGSIQGKGLFNNNYGVRYGNAVESYGIDSDGFYIHDCYASQVYDCCWTIQTQGAGTFNDIKFYNNVSEYCNSGLEVWQSGGTISNMDLYNNYTRLNGYGWSHQRPNKDGNFFYGASGSGQYENNHVRNNVNVFASHNALLVRTTGPEQYNFHDNVYVMEEGKHMGGIASNPGKGTGGWASMNTDYSEHALKRAAATGFEKGAKFYYTKDSAYNADMYDTYNPQVGVDLFTDIADNFWGRDAVDYVALKGYFNGVSANEFSPNGTMTRAMLVTVLSRIAGESANASDATFTDINKNAWYAQGVAWAEKKGIVNAGGKFRPDENATREELADMLYRYALSAYRTPDISKAGTFTDMASVNAAYVDGIKFCTANGIIGGYTDGTIKPKNNATRAEVATMIRRFNNYLATEPIDSEKILENAKTTTVKGEALKKMLDNTGVRATVEADGTVKFVPFLDKAKPVIRIMDQLSKEISLAERPYVVVKFHGELNSASLLSTVSKVNLSNGGGTDMNSNSYAAITSGAVIIDLSAINLAIDKDTYEDNLAINLYPWGDADVELDKAKEYFVIDELIFCDSEIVAKAIAG
ncbi:MAG: S-layer homology domain-containing protein [Clostridia bacterium]|nr:S-layer homology domain-containing protein [Clostridia bacterium]